MLAENWREVLAALGDAAPVFVLGLVSMAALLLLILFGGASWRRVLERRAQRSLALKSRREGGAFTINRDFLALTGDETAPVVVWKRCCQWILARDGLPAFILGGAVLALAVWLALRLLGIAPWAAAMLGLVLGVVAPLALKSHLRARWLKRFSDEFPSALDTMVRGLRAGLPVKESAQLVAEEGGPEIRSAFRLTLDDYEIGVPIEQSLARAAKSVPLDEVRFFAIVLALQNQTGGRLADMLETLSGTLRKRRELDERIQIMSQEARSSAAIIGALPILVGIILFMVSPEYLGLLFTTTAGTIAVVAAGLWMLLGAQVMRSMIRFDG